MKSIDLSAPFANLRTGKAWSLWRSSRTHLDGPLWTKSRLATKFHGHMATALNFGTGCCLMTSPLQPPGHRTIWDSYNGRPHISFDAESSVCITPSDLVPGGGVNPYDLKHKIGSSGEGPDVVFLFYFKVLCAKSEDYDVISFSPKSSL
jgi:hypothetical protein